jgi:hypothetical protein
MFKVTWEKISVTHQLSQGMVEKMLRLAYPDQTLISCELIAGGCANLNYKIQLKDESQPLILCVYLRDKDAAYREQKLAALIKETIPVPMTHFIFELEGYHFAIAEFMPGISLRDFLLGDALHDLSAIMYRVGTILSKITAYEFPKAGSLNHEIEVITYKSSDVIKFAQGCRFMLCTHTLEWAAAKHFRDTYFFGPHGVEDSYTWTFNHEEHAHLVLYPGTEIVAYAHIQFWPDQRAAIRIIATDENKRNQSFGSGFLAFIEKWLHSLGIKSIHAESRKSSLRSISKTAIRACHLMTLKAMNPIQMMFL